MAEIPGVIWIVVGLFIGLFSLFTGYINPVEYNAFFQLMMFIGIGMILFGFIKIQIKKKKNKPKAPVQHQQTQNTAHQQQQRKHPQYYSQSKHAQHHHPQQPKQTHIDIQQKASSHQTTAEKKCPGCGVPVMKRQKQCVMCGTKLR
jgi:predicted lipid-binding transport protein (Tim44 family)